MTNNSDILIQPITKPELLEFANAMSVIPWQRDISLYGDYLDEQERNKRVFLVARYRGNYAGFVSLIWQPKYQYFKDNDIPEISDLLVLEAYQGNGIGSNLILECEKLAKDKSKQYVGLGVGLYKDYGKAQKLYARLGYQLDGNGVTSHNEPIVAGSSVKVDDDLLIWLVKNLSK